MEPRGGDLEDARQVVVADQLQRVVDPFKETGGFDLHLADLSDGVAMEPPEPGPSPGSPLGTDEPVGRFEAVVQAVVDVAELQKLDVGEFDDLQGIGAIGVGNETRRPVEDDQVAGRIGEAQPGGLANFAGAERVGFQADEAGDPVERGARASRCAGLPVGRRCTPRSSR